VYQVIAQDAQATWALRRLGLHVLIHDRNADAALPHFQACLRTDDRDRTTWLAIGECYRRQGTLKKGRY